jgi:hypothetical protein
VIAGSDDKSSQAEVRGQIEEKSDSSPLILSSTEEERKEAEKS